MKLKTCGALAAASVGILCWTDLRAEPLWTQGIGTSSCGRLASDLKPSEGLGNPVNLMLYSWVQGYLSAANISTKLRNTWESGTIKWHD
jgi:hypothetical protein